MQVENKNVGLNVGGGVGLKHPPPTPLPTPVSSSSSVDDKHTQKPQGTGRSTVVDHPLMVRWIVGSILLGLTELFHVPPNSPQLV